MNVSEESECGAKARVREDRPVDVPQPQSAVIHLDKKRVVTLITEFPESYPKVTPHDPLFDEPFEQ
jgi:hypothetical protein